jgi:hypothetical protein
MGIISSTRCRLFEKKEEIFGFCSRDGGGLERKEHFRKLLTPKMSVLPITTKSSLKSLAMNGATEITLQRNGESSSLSILIMLGEQVKTTSFLLILENPLVVSCSHRFRL